ncbi:MAG: hypothetical protein WCK47_01860 [bacterium]|nr:hypothetical protein [Candidatus Sumerlaeota bacterium]
MHARSVAAGRMAWAVLLAFIIVAAFVSSFYSWTHNTHELVLRGRYPTWYRGGHVLFDGYGDYADAIRDWIMAPQTRWPQFQRFLHEHVHANTLIYPLLAALVGLSGLGTVWSCFAVTLAASVLCLYLFYLLILQRDREFGTPAKICFVAFVLHVPNLSGWCRPLPDMLALDVLLLFFLCYRRFRESGEMRWIVLCTGLCVAGALTKSVLLLLTPLLVVLLARNCFIAPCGSLTVRVRLSLAIAGALCVVAAAALAVSASHTPGIRFLVHSTLNALDSWRQAGDFKLVAFGALLFAGLSFNLYPLIAASGWKKGLAGREFEHIAWIALYLIQRFWHAGFNLGYGRARYGIPLAASALILALPGFQKLWPNRRTRFLVFVPVAVSLVIWLYFLVTLK